VEILDFKLYHRTIESRLSWYWHKNRHEVQWNRRPRNKPTQLQPYDFGKIAKNIHWRKQPLQQMEGKLVIYMEKTETRPVSITLFKNQFKMDKRS
jgi:hypothetical protein